MNEASKTSWALICGATPERISSPESAAGISPSSLQAGPEREKSGQRPAHAKGIPRRGKEKASRTNATSGRISSSSSRVTGLSASLANRLKRRLSTDGSIEYSLTWKDAVTPSRRWYSRLVGSARRTSDSEFIGWPTACRQDGPNGGPAQGTDRLPAAAALAGWPSASASDGEAGRSPMPGTSSTGMRPDGKKAQMGLQTLARFAGWPTTTTTTRDGKADGRDPPGRTGEPSLGHIIRGLILDLFLVPTGRRVVLAPEFSLWLMGFPEEWANSAPGAKDWQEAQAVLELGCLKAPGTPLSPSLPPKSSGPSLRKWANFL